MSELQEQLKLTTISTHIELEREQAELFYCPRDEFARLSECQSIWDIKSHQATDKFHERTTASLRIDRQKVSFGLRQCDLIDWPENVPYMPNSKGGEFFIFPGFILYPAAKEAFSVIDYHDVHGNASATSFQEEEGVPSDSKIIGHTWAKANKDGSRDKRFAGYYQIPIVKYGQVRFRSANGM